MTNRIKQAKAEASRALSAYLRAQKKYFALDRPKRVRKLKPMSKLGLRNSTKSSADCECYGCDKAVHLDADKGQRVGFRCLYCFRVYCSACAGEHFKPSYIATFRLASSDVERGALADNETWCRVDGVRGRIVNRKIRK